MIQACLACRLHNGNAVFVPCGHDWLLTPLHEASRSLCIAQEPAMSVPRVDHLFRRLTLQTAEGDRLLHVARHISLRELLRGLHLEAAAGSIPEAFDTGHETVTLPAAFSPTLSLAGIASQPGSLCEMAIVCTESDLFIMRRKSPLRLLQLAAIACEQALDPTEPLYLSKPAGLRIGLEDALPPLALLVPETDEPDIFNTSHLHSVGRGCTMQVSPQRITAHFPRSQAFQAWIGLPIKNFLAMGWNTHFCPNPPGDDDSLQVSWCPSPGRLHVHEEAFATALCHLFIAARAQAVSEATTDSPLISVAIQIVAETVWQGQLPLDFMNDLLLDWWHELTGSASSVHGCRLFSGPHPVPPGTTCASLLNGNKAKGFVRRSGCLLLCLHPSCSGGVSRTKTASYACPVWQPFVLLKELISCRSPLLLNRWYNLPVLAKSTPFCKFQETLDNGNRSWSMRQAVTFLFPPLPVKRPSQRCAIAGSSTVQSSSSNARLPQQISFWKPDSL